LIRDHLIWINWIAVPPDRDAARGDPIEIVGEVSARLSQNPSKLPERIGSADRTEGHDSGVGEISGLTHTRRAICGSPSASNGSNILQ
jgi:hypothetical protein